MKKLFVFDLDNTLRSTNLKTILPNARKLILEIAQHPDYVLALATGRGLAKLDVINDFSNLFKYKILVNGAVILEDDHVIRDYPIDQLLVDKIIKSANQKHISVGIVGIEKEVVTVVDQNIKAAFNNFIDRKPIEEPNFHLNNKVYQMWVYHKDETEIEKEIIAKYDLDIFHWHDGGFDMVSKGVSKANALLQLKSKYKDYQVIALGDGHNDLDMIGLADIGIIMENSRWIEAAKGKYQLIGPNVDSDELYEFLKNNKII